jgi:hypothetical protein
MATSLISISLPRLPLGPLMLYSMRHPSTIQRDGNQMPARKTLFLALGLSSAILLTACGEEAKAPATEVANTAANTPVAAVAQMEEATTEAVVLDVYKSETCGCCAVWIDLVEEQNFDTTIHHPTDLGAEKQRLGVAPQYQSCHTAVSPEGYVFEGHVPAKFMQKFLAEKPEGAIGLAVPGMPLGSPGMEVSDRFTPYDILLLKEDGSSEVYASMATIEDQY